MLTSDLRSKNEKAIPTGSVQMIEMTLVQN